MFKKRMVIIGLAALASLGMAGCNKGDELDFERVSVEPESFDMWVVGSAWANWTPANVSDTEKFTRNADGLMEYTVTVDHSGWWGFKFISTKAWSAQYGMEDVDYEKCNQAFKDELTALDATVVDYTSFKAKYKEGTGNRSNVSLYDEKKENVGNGTYKITYDPTNFETIDENDTTYSHKFVIEYTKAA